MIMSCLSDYLRIRHEHASKNYHTNRTTRNLMKRQIDDGQFGNDSEYIRHPSGKISIRKSAYSNLDRHLRKVRPAVNRAR